MNVQSIIGGLKTYNVALRRRNLSRWYGRRWQTGTATWTYTRVKLREPVVVYVKEAL